MPERVVKVASLALLAIVASAVASPPRAARAAPFPASVELRVVSVDASDKVSVERVPEIGDACGPALKALKKEGLEITFLHAGERQLALTLERSAKGYKPAAVVIIGCAPEEIRK